jgi:hypothetical protein
MSGLKYKIAISRKDFQIGRTASHIKDTYTGDIQWVVKKFPELWYCTVIVDVATLN